MKTCIFPFSVKEADYRKDLNDYFKTELKKVHQAIIDDIVRESVSLNTRTEFIMRGSFTIAVVRAKHKGKFYEALGIAVKSRKDTNDRDRGIQIAEGRARKALELKLRGHVITKKYMG